MAVGLLQERGLMYGLLEPAFTSEQEDHRIERDAQVEPERGVLHIPIVQRAFFFGGDKVAAVDLRPAGDPGRTIRRRCCWRADPAAIAVAGRSTTSRRPAHETIAAVRRAAAGAGICRPTNRRHHCH